MITAFTHDIKRIIEVTPVQNIESQIIIAKLYLNGCYKGVANTVRPDEDAGQVAVNLTNATDDQQTTLAVVYGKNRFEDSYSELDDIEFTVSANTTIDLQGSYDPKDYDEFKVGFSNSLININSVTVLKRQYQTINGVVVGGDSGETIAVPCDFRRFPPNEDYHLVFVAEDTGVIARELLTLFGKDGYGFAGCNND